MSSSRYPDSRYGRDRSPYRDRRPSTYGSTYPPRASDSTSRSNADPGGFPPRDTPRGPKSLVDASRGPSAGPPSGAPSAPRDGRARPFAGRGEAPLLRDAPPLSSIAHSHNSWRADRDRDRDFDRDRRDRRLSPRRSPVRDSRDSRDQRDFAPRDLDIGRARRNSRDGPPSAGSTYSDPPLVSGSSYRGSGIGRGRGGRDFHSDVRGRSRNFHDDRERHHDARDRMPDRSYRPRSRSRDPVRRDRDPRDDRDFDRRDRDDRRFVPREYDSYIGPAGSLKSGPRALDTHRGSGSLDSRHVPGTPTGAAPHPTHHSPADRLGPSGDSYSRRSSIATEPLGAKDSRREPARDDLLLASRAEASKERYAPRASSPPAAVPAFGFSSNVWRNPALDAKPVPTPQPPKPAPSAAPVPPAPPAPSASSPPAPSAPSTPVTTTPAIPTAPKANIPSGLSAAPPTGPKADRIPERSHGELPAQSHDSRPGPVDQPRIESRPSLGLVSGPGHVPGSEGLESKPLAAPSLPSAPANSPPQGPAARSRPPPTGPLRPNVSPSFPRPAHLPYVSRDAPRDSSPNAIPTPMGSRSSSIGGGPLSINTSPKSLPANIPTGPKADRGNPMGARTSAMYPPPDRPGFPGPRMSMGVTPKSMQWVRPGLNLNNRTMVPTKREFPGEDRDRPFGTAPKAPKLESSASATELRSEVKSGSPSAARPLTEWEQIRNRPLQGDDRKDTSPKLALVEARRLSDVSMTDASPRPEKPPMSAASSAPEVLDDSDDDLDLDEADFAESEAKYNREKALLEAKRIDLSASSLRATTPLQEIMLLASLTVEHLPQQEEKPADEEPMMIPTVQPPPESIATELPTPKAEEAEDVAMEKDEKDEMDERDERDEKDEKPLAPATRALRLRRGTGDEHEETPDLSSLPYLGSGPPTPISELEGPPVSESVMLAIRDKLRRSIEPELDTEDTLNQYAAAYRAWRLSIRELDDTKDGEEQERHPSTEPGAKVTTPDVQSSVVAPILDPAAPTTGRSRHSSRWATEHDLEAVLKESLKTAEEEGRKRDKEPKRSMADPEKEATVPLELTAYEAQRRRFIDTNFQREPGQGIFVFHYEPPEDDFTEEEHKIMVQHYKDQYAKKWGKLAEILYKEAGSSRTYKDCINHYYATKWGKEYKGKLKGRRGGVRRRGGAAGRGRGAIANMERADGAGDDGLPPALTETGRPRRSAAPTFGAETDPDTTASTPTPGRLRRQTDADGTQEKVGRRGKAGKEKGGRKGKAQPLAAAPAGSPVKVDRRAPGVKMEDEVAKRPLGEMPLPMQPTVPEEQLILDGPFHPGLAAGISERSKMPSSTRAGPSSYWSVTEQTDFQRNVAHFGTDWAAIASHMGTKTQTMVKNQYLRLVESGQVPDLARIADEADQRRKLGEDLGPPPTPTPAQKRRHENTVSVPRTLAPTPEATVSHPMALPKASPPSAVISSRLPNIAQAPQQGKPIVPSASGYPIPDSSLTAVPSIPQQQSPPGQASRGQSHHHIQHGLPQADSRRGPGPLAGYFSEDLPPRMDKRPSSQSSNMPQASRTLQPQVQAQSRAHEQPQGSLFRAAALQEREPLPRTEQPPEHDAHLRYSQHSRRISGEMPHNRQFPPAATSLSQMRPGTGAGSPESQPLPLQHRHIQQPQASVRPPPDAPAQPPSALPVPQGIPPRSAIATPPVKEEHPHYPLAHLPQPPQSAQSQVYPPTNQPPAQAAPAPPAPPAPKPAEPRKSNLLSLLNADEPEEPRRKKPVEQNVPSHTPTPQQQMPIAPPPAVSQALPPRVDPYSDATTSQATYGSRPSYAQQTALPQFPSSRHVVDLTSDQTAGGRVPPRESWQRQPYPGQSQPQPPQAHNSPHTGLARPAFGFGDHRSVFAQHNAPRHNPSPPPLTAFTNSPHLHSRTPSISGPPGQQPRHGIATSASGQLSQTAALQANPYAQVDPPGSSSQPTGPVGMRPSPHLHTSHVGSQRELHNQNEQSQALNRGLPYSNPHTPSEHHPANQHSRGPSITEYRPRDHHEFDPRNTDRDVSREMSHRADALLTRPGAPPSAHQDIRYQPPPPHDRPYAQRSHTPLSRPDHAPPLQHPPHSSLGESHALYGQRLEDRYRDPYAPRESRIADQMNREREMREREQRDREMRDRDPYRDGFRRGPPPPPGPGQDQRGGPPQQMDWTSAVRPQQERWQR